MVCRIILSLAVVAGGCLSLGGSTAWAARGKKTNTDDAKASKSVEQQGELQTVELFKAMEAGQIDVKFIPKDSTHANVIIKNKQDKPLRIQLPAAFAALPVLAQRGGQVGGVGDAVGGNGYGSSNTTNSSQGLGGGFGMGGMGMGGLGMGMGGMGMGGGFFNVAAEGTGKIQVTTVCLEHGKPDPGPRIPYVIKPIDSFTKDQQVIELCKMLGRGELDQVSAQAAAWHLANGLSWNELASKVKFRHRTGAVQMYFNPAQLRTAMLAAHKATLAAKASQQQETESPGELDLSRAR